MQLFTSWWTNFSKSDDRRELGFMLTQLFTLRRNVPLKTNLNLSRNKLKSFFFYKQNMKNMKVWRRQSGQTLKYFCYVNVKHGVSTARGDTWSCLSTVQDSQFFAVKYWLHSFDLWPPACRQSLDCLESSQTQEHLHSASEQRARLSQILCFHLFI